MTILCVRISGVFCEPKLKERIAQKVKKTRLCEGRGEVHLDSCLILIISAINEIRLHHPRMRTLISE